MHLDQNVRYDQQDKTIESVSVHAFFVLVILQLRQLFNSGNISFTAPST